MTDTSSTFEKTAQSPKAWWDDIQLSVVFLTRLPWRLEGDIPSRALNRALRAFPIIGLLIGAIGATVFGLAHWLGLPSLAASLLAIGATIIATGALHEDGLADVADGFGGGATKERKLAIMRDSTVGSYGALALVLSVGLRISALDGFNDWMVGASALIGAACLSRIAPALLIRYLDPARSDGLAATMEKPDDIIVWQTCALGAALFLLCTPFWAGWLALLLSLLVLVGFGKIARKQIGGQTGDVCGAAQQLVEITALLALVALS